MKVGLLGGAMLLASVNLLWTTPAAPGVGGDQPDVGPATATLLRRLVGAEVVLVAAIVFAAAVLSSLPPPAKALGDLGGARVHVGPGPVSKTVEHDGYTLEVRVTPNRAAQPNKFAVSITRDGKPVTGADVTATFAMLDMEMGQQGTRSRRSRPGCTATSAPALVMVGHWGITFQVEPPGGQPFDVVLVDRANG